MFVPLSTGSVEHNYAISLLCIQSSCCCVEGVGEGKGCIFPSFHLYNNSRVCLDDDDDINDILCVYVAALYEQNGALGFRLPL